MNNKQIEWLNAYCEKQEQPFFLTNAGNIAYIYKMLKELE